jgi:hypothetical protein
VKAIIQQGYQGEQIREHLHRERLTVTKKIISAFKTQAS